MVSQREPARTSNLDKKQVPGCYPAVFRRMWYMTSHHIVLFVSSQCRHRGWKLDRNAGVVFSKPRVRPLAAFALCYCDSRRLATPKTDLSPLLRIKDNLDAVVFT